MVHYLIRETQPDGRTRLRLHLLSFVIIYLLRLNPTEHLRDTLLSQQILHSSLPQPEITGAIKPHHLKFGCHQYHLSIGTDHQKITYLMYTRVFAPHAPSASFTYLLFAAVQTSTQHSPPIWAVKILRVTAAAVHHSCTALLTASLVWMFVVVGVENSRSVFSAMSSNTGARFPPNSSACSSNSSSKVGAGSSKDLA